MADSPFKSLADMISYAKENPGAVTIGGSGISDVTHTAHLQFEKMVGAEYTYVRYKMAKVQRMA